LVFVGGDDGRLRALDAQTGAARWTYTSGGALRCGPTVAGSRLYVTSDDGVLHCIETRDARVVWQVRVNRTNANRLPPGDPNSKFDLHGAAVTVVGATLFLGTHEGRVLALAAADGSAHWSFAAGDRFLAAPHVAGGRVFAGCYDGKVYALEAKSGALRWSFDAKAPVTSTPVLVQDVVVVGSRAYDLWGLDANTGRPRWSRYVWFTWIESSAAVAGRTAYVGSSDGAKLLAFDALTGRGVWTTDVHGYAWGTPVLDRDRIYIGTRGEMQAIDHRAHALALDRATGKVVWRYPFTVADPRITHGYGAGAALAADRVYLAAVEGRVHAFAAR
jgi:outer membrane protein assembly factor BamB